jgi:hypothetical protein
MTSSAATRPDPRLGAAVAAARITGAAIRRLGRGGGTAAPGLVADRIDPGLLGKIAGRLASGTVVVAGTNGKTTVSRMVADILESSGLAVAHNRSGSNMVRGVASALAERSTLRGDPRPMPASSRATKPRCRKSSARSGHGSSCSTTCSATNWTATVNWRRSPTRGGMPWRASGRIPPSS